MNVLWIDASNGAAGDMLLAALLDAGADADAVHAGIARLPMAAQVRVAEVRRYGLRGLHLTVHAPDAAPLRTLDDLTALVTAAALPAAVTEFAQHTLAALGQAESAVHGIELSRVHFHEIGAVDTVVDVVGCGLALHSLGLLAPRATVVVSPVAVGAGTVQTEHGRLPVPPPAVLALLTAAGAPVAEHPARMELCTPTGAALLTTLAGGWGPMPAMRLRLAGVGAGSANPRSHANVLRVAVGQLDRRPSQDWSEQDLVMVEATIDDMDPRLWPHLLDELRRAGAADAWQVPVLMRKGRPGALLQVLVDQPVVDAVCRLVFEQTTTLGVRTWATRRRALDRDTVRVPYGDHLVDVKRGHLGPEVVTVQPEFDDVLRASRGANAPVADVLEVVRAAARASAHTGGRSS